MNLYPYLHLYLFPYLLHAEAKGPSAGLQPGVVHNLLGFLRSCGVFLFALRATVERAGLGRELREATGRTRRLATLAAAVVAVAVLFEVVQHAHAPQRHSCLRRSPQRHSCPPRSPWRMTPSCELKYCSWPLSTYLLYPSPPSTQIVGP